MFMYNVFSIELHCCCSYPLLFVSFFFSLFFLMIRRPPRSTRTDTLFPSRRSSDLLSETAIVPGLDAELFEEVGEGDGADQAVDHQPHGDRKSTRLNSSH